MRWMGAVMMLVGLQGAAVIAQQPQAKGPRPKLPHEFVMPPVRVFYETQGPHAVDAADVNGNGTPDQVEDIAAQAWAAYTLYVKALEFPDPMTSERYTGAAFIDVQVLSKEWLKSNGVAYDGFLPSGRPTDPPGTRTLRFDVASSVHADANGTPGHEMFHLIQNGATFFKTRWFTEGMARWSERGLGSGAIGEIKRGADEPWPDPPQKFEALFASTYAADGLLWNPLAAMDDAAGAMPVEKLPRELAEMRYVSGKKVLADTRLTGWRFMRDVLVELSRADDVAYEKLGYTDWTEANQQSLGNSPYIYEAVMDVARRRGHTVGPFSAAPPLRP